jgi:Fe-S-cluster containining protein
MRDARRGPRRVAKEREAALEDDLINRLEILYQDMDAAYHAAAREGSFSCQGCDGAACCTVDLAIHTYAEMAYLRLGFHELPRAIKTEMGERARLTVLAKDCAPLGDEYRSAVCAANFEGQCVLYRHRPMICRLAGIPYTATRPGVISKEPSSNERERRRLRNLGSQGKISRFARNDIDGECGMTDRAPCNKSRGRRASSRSPLQNHSTPCGRILGF